MQFDICGAIVHDAAYRCPRLCFEADHEACSLILHPAIVRPTNPEHSVLLFRMGRLGTGRMPHVASNVVVHVGADLKEYIRSLKD